MPTPCNFLKRWTQVFFKSLCLFNSQLCYRKTPNDSFWNLKTRKVAGECMQSTLCLHKQSLWKTNRTIECFVIFVRSVTSEILTSSTGFSPEMYNSFLQILRFSEDILRCLTQMLLMMPWIKLYAFILLSYRFLLIILSHNFFLVDISWKHIIFQNIAFILQKFPSHNVFYKYGFVYSSTMMEQVIFATTGMSSKSATKARTTPFNFC